MREIRQDGAESGEVDEGRWRNRPEWSYRDARMRRFIFTEEVQQALAKERYHHPDPHVQQRMEIVLLKSKGETHERIGELAGVSRRTVQRVLDVFAKEGLDGLRKFYWHGQPSALTPHQESLEAEFRERPPHTVSEACQRIEELTGVCRKPTRVRKFLRETLKLSWRKVAAVPVPPKLTVAEHAKKQASFLKSGT
jgi:transposase